MRLRALQGVAAALTVGVVVLGGCEQILGVPDRKQGGNIASCAGGVCTCEPGWDDCDGIPGNGCEAALGGDEASKNCGACGHDCLGGKCGTDGCEPILATFDPTQSHMGPVVFEGNAFVAEFETQQIFVLRPDSTELVKLGDFDGQVLHFKPSAEGGHLFTMPLDEVLSVDPPFHAKVFRVTGEGVSLAAELDLGVRWAGDFAATSAGWYLAGYDPDVGYQDVYRFDRATGASKFFLDGIDIIDARGDTLYWADYSDLFEQVEGGAPVLVFDAEINDSDYYVTSDDFVYGFNAHDLDTGKSLLTRVRRADGQVDVIEDADVAGLAADPEGSCWLDQTNSKVWLWREGETTPTVLAEQMRFETFGFEQFHCARDTTSTYWLDQQGLHRRVKPLPPP